MKTKITVRQLSQLISWWISKNRHPHTAQIQVGYRVAEDRVEHMGYVFTSHTYNREPGVINLGLLYGYSYSSDELFTHQAEDLLRRIRELEV